jgi:hypothetical protein
LIIIDDILPSHEQDEIEEFSMHAGIPWAFTPNISSTSLKLDTDVIGFGRDLIDNYISPIRWHDVYNYFEPKIELMCSQTELNLNDLLRARMFLTVPSYKPANSLWHTDFNMSHAVMIYYINDSTGPTEISEYTYDDYDNVTINDVDNIPVVHSIEPKKGRAVIFNGKYHHRSTLPDTNPRFIINMNFKRGFFNA